MKNRINGANAQPRRPSQVVRANTELDELFSLYDDDKDGMLNPDELRKMFCTQLNMVGIRVTETQFTRYEEIFDGDHDKRISLQQFKRVLMEYYRPIDRQ